MVAKFGVESTKFESHNNRRYIRTTPNPSSCPLQSQLVNAERSLLQKNTWWYILIRPDRQWEILNIHSGPPQSEAGGYHKLCENKVGGLDIWFLLLTSKCQSDEI